MTVGDFISDIGYLVANIGVTLEITRPEGSPPYFSRAFDITGSFKSSSAAISDTSSVHWQLGSETWANGYIPSGTGFEIEILWSGTGAYAVYTTDTRTGEEITNYGVQPVAYTTTRTYYAF